MANAWLVRPKPHDIPRLNEFKTQNIVAIGWPGIGDLSGKSREEIKDLLTKPPYEYDGLILGNAYATIDIFVNQIEEGDLVLCPDGDDIYFGVITSGYFFNPDADKDGYPHQRSITWKADKGRKDLSKELRSALKVHRTTANLSHHYDEIDALCNGHAVPTPDVVKTVPIRYTLRPDYVIKFDIPEDITDDEAKRLSTFFTTMYFKG